MLFVCCSFFVQQRWLPKLDSNHARGKKHSFCPLLAKNSPPDCFLNAVTPANLSDGAVGESTGKANKRDTNSVSLRTRTTSWATSTAFARLHEKQSSIVFLSLRPLCSFASLSRRRLVGSRRTTRGKANKRDTHSVSFRTRTTPGRFRLRPLTVATVTTLRKDPIGCARLRSLTVTTLRKDLLPDFRRERRSMQQCNSRSYPRNSGKISLSRAPTTIYIILPFRWLLFLIGRERRSMQQCNSRSYPRNSDKISLSRVPTAP